MGFVTIGLVGVGAMGAAVGGSLVSHGNRVVSVLGDRTPVSQQRATRVGIEAIDDLDSLVSEAEVVLSIVPPGIALKVAADVAVSVTETGVRDRTFVDCNAISPDRSREVAAVVASAGLAYVDGGLIGAPPAPDRPVALYLSGPGGDRLAAALSTPEISANWLGAEPAAASALKMAYAAWTKGVNALVLSITAMARAEGVEAAMLDEWQRSQPQARAARDRAPSTAEKAWRWVAEMEEIAATLDGAGLPDGAFRAAAEIYRRLETFKDAERVPSVDEMVDRLYLPPITPGT